MTRVAIITLGCKVNQAESAAIEKKLRDAGCAIVKLCESPQCCIVNTCTVTAKSDYQSRQMVRRAAKAGASVIVTGCYAELHPEIFLKFGKDIQVVSNNKKPIIPEILTNRSESTGSVYANRSRPYLKIQDGCNSQCSYCTIPAARGRSRSVDPQVVLENAQGYEREGYPEIVLTGIHIGQYGLDLRERLTLGGLIKEILKGTGRLRLRLSSLEPNELREEIISIFREPRVCNHLHIPLQSGDDDVLKRMKRGYRSHHYIEKVASVASEIDGISIGTDVIVGFPGETEEGFCNTMKLLSKLPFSYIHAFPFSARPGTEAFSYPGAVPPEEKKKRCAEVIRLHRQRKREYLAAQIGRDLEVVVEEHNDNGSTIGTSANYLKVRMPSATHAKKSLVRVRITGSDGNILSGVPIENP